MAKNMPLITTQVLKEQLQKLAPPKLGARSTLQPNALPKATQDVLRYVPELAWDTTRMSNKRVNKTRLDNNNAAKEIKNSINNTTSSNNKGANVVVLNKEANSNFNNNAGARETTILRSKTVHSCNHKMVKSSAVIFK